MPNSGMDLQFLPAVSLIKEVYIDMCISLSFIMCPVLEHIKAEFNVVGLVVTFFNPDTSTLMGK